MAFHKEYINCDDFTSASPLHALRDIACFRLSLGSVNPFIGGRKSPGDPFDNVTSIFKRNNLEHKGIHFVFLPAPQFSFVFVILFVCCITTIKILYENDNGT